MSFVILLSVAIRLAAFAWGLRLLATLRDWRLGFLVAMVGLMAVRQVLTGFHRHGEDIINFHAHVDEWPGALVSVLALLAIVYIGRLIAKHQGDERAIRGSRDELRRLLDALPVLISYVGKDRRYHYVNEAYEQWLGIPRETVLNRSVKDTLGETNYKGIELHIAKALQGETVTFANVLEFPRRGSRLVEVSYIPDQGDRGEVNGFFVLVKDMTEHKRIEKTLREKEALAAQAAELAELGYWQRCSKLQRMTKCSDQMAAIMGRPAEELQVSNDDYIAYIFPEDRERYRTVIEEGNATRTAYEVDVRIVRPDGEVRFIRESARYIADDGDSSEFRVIGTTQDITQEKMDERALRESQERFRDFAESASDWYWETDPELRFTVISKGSEQATGLRSEDFIGKTREELSNVIVDPESWKSHLDDLRNRRPFRDFIYARRVADDRVQHFRTSGRPFYDAEGRFLGYRGVGSDVTRVIEAQTAERQSERFLAQALEAIPASFSLYDAEDRLLLSNQNYENICDIGRDVVGSGARFEDIVRAFADGGGVKGSDAEAEEWTARRLDRRRNPAHNFEYQRGDGLWTQLNDYLLEDGTVITIGSSVTEKKQAEKARREHEAALAHLLRRNTMGEMAAALAHELNQPLTAVVNFSGGCLRRLRSGRVDMTELGDVMEGICDQSQRASEVLRRIRDFVGVSEPEKTEVDIHETLKSVQALARPELDAAHVTTKVRIPKYLPLAFASEIEIEQVLLNLVKNSIEAMDGIDTEKREMLIEVSHRRTGSIEFAVSDTGVGFPSAEVERFFEPYVTTKRNGLGMGLAISKTIVEAHGGRIWVDNDACRGATVHLTLPTVEGAERDAA